MKIDILQCPRIFESILWSLYLLLKNSKDPQKIEIGGIYDGVITNIKPFGLFVKFLSDHIGLVHKSVLKKKGVQIYDFKPKQRIQVKVKDIKDDGKINLEVI